MYTVYAYISLYICTYIGTYIYIYIYIYSHTLHIRLIIHTAIRTYATASSRLYAIYKHLITIFKYVDTCTHLNNYMISFTAGSPRHLLLGSDHRLPCLGRMLYHIIVCYIILYYDILYYIMTYYIIV